MSDGARGERLQIMLTPEELEALDNWRFARRMPSRAAAIRELLKRGLADETASASGRTRSREFGVIEADNSGLASEPPDRSAPGHNGGGRSAEG